MGRSLRGMFFHTWEAVLRQCCGAFIPVMFLIIVVCANGFEVTVLWPYLETLTHLEWCRTFVLSFELTDIPWLELCLYLFGRARHRSSASQVLSGLWLNHSRIIPAEAVL